MVRDVRSALGNIFLGPFEFLDAVVKEIFR